LGRLCATATGVGQDEEALAEVRRADLRRAETIPCCIEPEAGQRPENLFSGTASVDSKEPWDVLDKDPLGSNVPNDAPDVGPEPARVRRAEALARVTRGLAGEAGRDEIHAAAP
jgi:hypothetical protein